MEQYDYRDNGKIAKRIGVEFDRLTTKQLNEVMEAIEDIKRTGERNDLAYHSEWFDKALLPVWKDIAERTSSLLEVERDGNGIIAVLLRNPNGIDIMEDCRSFYMLIMMAVGLIVQADGGDINLSMTYDCKKFVN